jgi:hypothetical protein
MSTTSSTTTTTTTTTTSSTSSTTTTTTIPLGLYTDNFSGASPLDNWTEYWLSANFSQTIAASAKTQQVGSNNLLLENSAAQRSVLTYDPPGSFSDGEILALVNLDDNAWNYTYGIRIGLRISGTTGNENGYFCDPLGKTSDRLTITRNLNGAGSTLATEYPLPFYSTSNQHWIRFRVEGTSLKVKIWEAGLHEPDEWALETTDSNLSSGRCGLGVYDNGAKYYCEYFAVDSSGGTVPVPSLTSGNYRDGLGTIQVMASSATINSAILLGFPVPSGLNGKYLDDVRLYFGDYYDNIRIAVYLGSDPTDITDAVLVEDFGISTDPADSVHVKNLTVSQQVSTGDVVWVALKSNDGTSKFYYSDGVPSGQGQLCNGRGRWTTNISGDETVAFPANLSSVTGTPGDFWYLGSITFSDSPPTTTTTSTTTSSTTSTTSTTSSTTTTPPCWWNDDFTGSDDDPPDTDRWTMAVSGASATYRIHSNALEMDINNVAGGQYVYAYLDKKFAGDFDIEVKIDWVSYANLHNHHGPRIAMFNASTSDYIRLGAHYWGGHVFYKWVRDDWSNKVETSVARSNDQTYLRIVRVDNDCTLYYKDGWTDSWNDFGTYQCGSDLLTLRLENVGSTGSAFSSHVHFDDFVINSGCPGADGPTTTTTTSSTTTTTTSSTTTTNTQSSTTSSSTTTNTQSTTTSSTTTTNTQSTTTSSTSSTASTTTTGPPSYGPNTNTTTVVVTTV